MVHVRIGINAWSYPSTINMHDAIKHAKSAGFELFEPVIDESDLNSFNSSDFSRKWSNVKETAEGAGIGLYTIATGLYWRFNMILEDQFEKVSRVLETQAKAASIIGAKVLLVVPGVAVPELSYEKHIERAKATLSKLAKIAENYSVVIGVENVWNRMLASPLDMRMLLNELDPKVVGVYLDVGNTLPHSLPEHWIMTLKDRIVAMHAKDFLAEPNRCTFGIPLTGSVNWSNVKKLLNEIGYGGPLTAEIPPYPGDPLKAAEDTASSLKRIFG
ncbi:sugar phosphate isomerase/epimerase family protein [Caldivirga sp.]|uniref:sugar phosphate isomerase/epimerase family protein n=1 Tax=Caldivirga sp. TaxID=2080243 RepID=UPI003D096BFF